MHRKVPHSNRALHCCEVRYTGSKTTAKGAAISALLWLVVGMVLSSLWFTRPSLMPIALVALYVGVPYAAGGGMTGGFGHPGTIVALTAIVLAAVFRSRDLFRELNERATIYLLMLVVLAYLVITLRFGTDGQNVQVETFVSPFVLVLIFRLSSRWTSVSRQISLGVIWVALVQVVVSFVAWANGGPLFYVAQYTEAYRWFSPTLTRAMGTTDHALVLSLFLASAIPLVAAIRSAWMQLSVIVVLAIGLLLTESRTGLLAGVIGVVYLTMRRGRSFGYRFVIFAGGAAAAAVLLSANIAEDVLGKFSDDSGSSFVRGVALNSFVSEWSNFIFSGWGNDGATQFRSMMGLNSSLESAALIFSVNYGIVFTLIYFGVAVVLVLSRGAAPTGARLAAFVALVLVQSFSSLGTNSASAVILWTFVAIATLRDDEHVRREDQDAQDDATRPRTSRVAPHAAL